MEQSNEYKYSREPPIGRVWILMNRSSRFESFEHFLINETSFSATTSTMLFMESARITETRRNLPMAGGSSQEYLFQFSVGRLAIFVELVLFFGRLSGMARNGVSFLRMCAANSCRLWNCFTFPIDFCLNAFILVLKFVNRYYWCWLFDATMGCVVAIVRRQRLE